MIPCSVRADVSIDVAETEDKVMRLSKAKWADRSQSGGGIKARFPFLF